MISNNIIATVFLVALLTKCGGCNNKTKYAVPEPKIEVFAEGFRASIPDQEGINLFAFHANINVPMDGLVAGQFSKDVLKKADGHWVFEDITSKLNIGDVIYYWLFVIKFNLGYRYDNGKFVVKEILPYTSLKIESESPLHIDKDVQSNWYFEPLDKITPNIHIRNNKSNSHTLNNKSNSQINLSTVLTEHKPMSTCCQLFLNLTSQISILSENIDRLTEENKILSEIAQKDDHYSKTLRIFGKYPSEYYPTTKEFVQNLISEKLQLSGIKVRDVNKIPDNGISFKVETLKDKLKIILAAQVKLEGSNYEISY